MQAFPQNCSARSTARVAADSARIDVSFTSSICNFRSEALCNNLGLMMHNLFD